MWDNPTIYLVILGAGSALVTAGIWIGSVNSDRETFREFMAEIREDIKKILSRLPPGPLGTESPLTLTDYGVAIAEAVGAHQWAKEHAQIVRDRVRGKAAYEIQEISFAYAREEYELSPSMLEAMYEPGYSRRHVQAVLGVVLRDELLAAEAEIAAPKKAQTVGRDIVSAGPRKGTLHA